MRIELVEQGIVYLIVPCKSGVVFRAQAGGILCAHPEIEGSIIAAAHDCNDLAGDMCHLSCYGEKMKPEHMEDARKSMQNLRWECFTGIEDMRLDPDKLDESVEGWWHVIFSLVSDRYHWQRPEQRIETRGVICGPNCD